MGLAVFLGVLPEVLPCCKSVGQLVGVEMSQGIHPPSAIPDNDGVTISYHFTLPDLQ